jgi:hypothetical protein
MMVAFLNLTCDGGHLSCAVLLIGVIPKALFIGLHGHFFAASSNAEMVTAGISSLITLC